MQQAVRSSRLRELPAADFFSSDQSEIPFPTHCFMHESIWLKNAWCHYHRFQPGVDQSSLRGLIVSDEEGNLLGNSVWYQQVHHAISWWRMVGCGAICNDYVQMPCCPESEREVAVETALWLHSRPRKFLGLPTGIEIDGHRSDSSQWQAFFDTLRSKDWTLDSVPIEGAWRLGLPDNWQAYEGMLHKSHRRKARRAIKLLDSSVVQHRAFSSPNDIELYWPEFVRLHQKRRHQLGQAGCFADPHYENFLKSAVMELAAQNAVWLSFVHADSQAIAGLLIFDSGKTSYLYQSGIDTERLDLEPGHLINAATIRACIERGQLHFDFLRGDERYKSNWRASRISLQRSVLFPPGFTGRSLASARRLRRSFLGWVSTQPV